MNNKAVSCLKKYVLGTRIPALCVLAYSLSLTSVLSGQESFDVPEEVSFRSDDIISEGTRISAEIFSPKVASRGTLKKLPTILMSHGWGGTAEGLRADAIEFAKNGFLVVTIDYRGWGNSDARLVATSKPKKQGDKLLAEVTEVRGVVDPIDQTTDILNALHWIRGEELCDPNRIGIWGSSFAGGHVVYVAARDPRVKAFVSQVGSMDARWVLQSRDLRTMTFQQGLRRTRGEIGYPEPFANFSGMKGQPVWEKLMRYAPIEDIERCENVQNYLSLPRTKSFSRTKTMRSRHLIVRLEPRSLLQSVESNTTESIVRNDTKRKSWRSTGSKSIYDSSKLLERHSSQ